MSLKTIILTTSIVITSAVFGMQNNELHHRVVPQQLSMRKDDIKCTFCWEKLSQGTIVAARCCAKGYHRKCYTKMLKKNPHEKCHQCRTRLRPKMENEVPKKEDPINESEVLNFCVERCSDSCMLHEVNFLSEFYHVLRLSRTDIIDNMHWGL